MISCGMVLRTVRGIKSWILRQRKAYWNPARKTPPRKTLVASILEFTPTTLSQSCTICFPCHSLSFVSELLCALDKSSNTLVLAQACREKHSAFAHVHNRKEIPNMVAERTRQLCKQWENCSVEEQTSGRNCGRAVDDCDPLVRFRATAVSLRVRSSRLSLCLCRR